jgi:hypothetical protein
MSNVTNIRHAIPVSADMSKAIQAFSMAIATAIDDAKAVGLPQGFVVSILHGQALSETQKLID